MSKSKEQLQQAVLDVGEHFAASMDTLLDTELRYLKYLRNRKRFHIGVRNIISNGLGSGQLPPDDPKPTKPRRNPRRPRGGGVGVPVPVPIFVPEREREYEDDTSGDIPVLVPERQDQPQDEGANDIKDFDREKLLPDPEEEFEPAFPDIKVLIPENTNEDASEPDGGLVTVPDTGGITLPEWDKNIHPTPHDYWAQYGQFPEGTGDWKNDGWDWGQFIPKMPEFSWKDILPGIMLFMRKAILKVDAGFTPSANASEMFSQPTETIIGEDGAEIVIPVDELGDLIGLVYKDGAEMFIGTSYDFLSGLPSSPGKTAVLGDANRLASIFGITNTGDGSSLSLGLEEPITFTSTSTEEEENIEEVIDTPVNSSGSKKEFDLESIEKESLKEAVKSDGESRVAKRRKSKKSYEEIKAEIDAKELAKNQNKANIVSDGSEQVKIPSDGNGEDRFGNDIILNNPTELAWQKAIRAAALDGVDLASGVNSSFRTPDQQQQLLDLQDAGDPIVAQVADIGTSPHQQGWGLDIAIGTPAHQWMLQNGKKYNFDWAGTDDPVHFNFVNNESNTKYLEDLQPRRSRNNMERDLEPVPRDKNLLSKKAKAKIGATTGALAGLGMMSNDIVPPNIQTDKEIVSTEQVNQIDKNQTMISSQPNMIPIPIQTTVQVPVPMAKNETKEIKRTLIIDTFDKGSRVEVAYV